MGGQKFSDTDLRRMPARFGVSHVAVVATSAVHDPVVRFFTSEGELPGCGHGTVAVIAALTVSGPSGSPPPARLGIVGRAVACSGAVENGTAGAVLVSAWFEQGVIARRAATDDELHAFLEALAVDSTALHASYPVEVASPGRERLLVPVPDADVLAGLRPDMHTLAAASRRYGQLGCLAYVPPPHSGRVTARMFAPAIGVPEDIANANSTRCLAALMLMDGHDPAITVDQGDALGRPSSVHATARLTPQGFTASVGGIGRVRTN
jgi:trans-2,3-dihydro-3-hydroxyanthranilate isomerase